jgi:hypothetical protein
MNSNNVRGQIANMAVSLPPLTTYGTDGDTLARVPPAAIHLSLVITSLRDESFKPLSSYFTIGQYNVTATMIGNKKIKFVCSGASPNALLVGLQWLHEHDVLLSIVDWCSSIRRLRKGILGMRMITLEDLPSLPTVVFPQGPFCAMSTSPKFSLAKFVLWSSLPTLM